MSYSTIVGYLAIFLLRQVFQYNGLRLTDDSGSSLWLPVLELAVAVICVVPIGLLILFARQNQDGWERLLRFGPAFTRKGTRKKLLLIRFSERREFRRPTATA